MKRLLTILILHVVFVTHAQEKLTLNPENIINISTWDYPAKLIDEQALAGDPKNGTGGEPETKWQPGWTDWHYPASVIIDLGKNYRLSDIYMYDINGSGDISFYAGTPFQWDSLFTYPQNAYMSWQGFEVDIVTRYLKITIWSVNTVPTEIVVYGTLESEINETFEILEHEKPLMKDFIGMNGFINDPVEVLAAGGFLREYHNWGFTEVEANVFEFDRWNGFWDFDAYYDSLKNAGVTVSPCLQGNVSYHSSADREKPLNDGEDPEDPLSYSEHAQLMFQYAARYGSVAVDESLLLLNSNQEARTGLNLIEYYENWNEQDAWWSGRDGWFSPYEYAAMSSADFDGHMGALGQGFGLKTADPNAKFVMAGTALLDLEYVKSMMFWFQYHRNDGFPFDVLNFHHYSNDHGGQGSSQVGVSPEQDSLRERIKELVDFRDKYLHGKEIWITEFGYDTHNESVQRAPVYGDYTAYEVQAMWLIRSYLAISAAGADKAAMYMSRDVDRTDATKYSTSGLTTERTNRQKKDSWYYVSTLTNQLGNSRFDRIIESGNENVWIYKYIDESSSETSYVVWCPTADGTTVDNYTLDLEEERSDVNVVDFVDDDADGDTISSIQNINSIVLNISERPVIVKAISLQVDPNTLFLRAGWNLISFNKQMASMNIADVIEPIANDIEILKTAEAYFAPDNPEYLNSLDTIEIGQAYLIYSGTATNLAVNGDIVVASEYTTELHSGWNMVGIPYNGPRSLEETLQGIIDNVEAIKNYNGIYIPGESGNSLNTLVPGAGYLIKVSQDCTIQW